MDGLEKSKDQPNIGWRLRGSQFKASRRSLPDSFWYFGK